MSETEVHTAHSPSDISSKDVETARESTQSLRELMEESSEGFATAVSAGGVPSLCSSLSGASVELNSDNLRTCISSNSAASLVAEAQTFLQPGTLPVDAQRSITEVNGGQELSHTPQSFDARASLSAKNLGAAPTNDQLASVEGDGLTPAERCSSSKDVTTAREPTMSEYELSGPSEDVTTAREPTFDEWNGITPSGSSQSVITAREPTAAEMPVDADLTPAERCSSSKDVTTAREPTMSEYELSGPSADVRTAQSPSDVSSKDVQTAVEIGQQDLDFLASLNNVIPSFNHLPVEAQRSVTEVHGGQHLTQTPQSFDARASLSAKNLGAAPTKDQLASVEGEVQTAREDDGLTPAERCSSSKDVTTAQEPTNSEYELSGPTADVRTAQSPSDVSSKDVTTAVEPAELDENFLKAFHMAAEAQHALHPGSAGEGGVQTAKEERSSQTSSLSRYHSFENLPEATRALRPASDEEGMSPTPEQMLAMDRKKRDAQSYYHEPTLNKGPVDRAARRLRSVSSQYAFNELPNYAMDDPNEAYKLKTQMLSPASALVAAATRSPAATNVLAAAGAAQANDNGISPTPEQIIAMNRQSLGEPAAYYHEPSLNKGIVDEAPRRLRTVPSEYATDGLSNYAMNDPSHAYLLKSQPRRSSRFLQRERSSHRLSSTNRASPTFRNSGSSKKEEDRQLRLVPSEYAMDMPQHAYQIKSQQVFNNNNGWQQ